MSIILIYLVQKLIITQSNTKRLIFQYDQGNNFRLWHKWDKEKDKNKDHNLSSRLQGLY